MPFAFASGEDPVTGKLDALKARGLDFHDAALFLPFANDKGWFPYVESKVVQERWKNKDRPVAFFFNAQWEKNSRLKDRYCLYFDGRNLSGSSGGGRLFQHEDSHTIAAWVAFEEPMGASMIFCEGCAGIGGRNLSLSWGYAEHAVQAKNSKRLVAGLKFVPKARQWTHLAGVYDREENVLRLYINGKLAKEVAADIPPIVVDASGFYIGANKEGGPSFKGWMDELLVYSRPLSGDEIGALYGKGVPDKGCEFVPAPPILKPGEKEFSDRLSWEDVWFYADYDKTLSPAYSCGAAGTIETRSRFAAGTPSFGQGKFGEAVRLESGEKASFADTLSYGMRTPRDQFTVSFWFKPDVPKWTAGKLPWGRTFFSWIFGNPSMFYGGGIHANAGASPEVNLAEDGKSATTFSEDRWTHLALVSSVSGRTIVYVDGNPKASADLPCSRNFGNELFIGSSWNARADKGLRIDGWIDDVTVMKTALSEEAVKHLAAGDKPASDLMSGVGFASPRTAFKRGEKISYPVRLPFQGTVTAQVAAAGANPVAVFSGEGTTPAWTLPLDTLQLKPGDYELTVTVSKGAAQSQGRKSIRILPAGEPAIPFGIYSTTDSIEDMPGYLEKWRDIGMTFMHDGGAGVAYSRILRIDSLYRQHIGWVPNLGTSHLTDAEKEGLKPADCAQLEAGTGALSGNNSPFSAVVQAKLAERIKGVVSQCSGHPGFRQISLWDEYDSRTDVSPGAMRRFTEKTGLADAPDFKARPKGTVVPDNDPYARWIDTFGVGLWMNKGLGYHDALMTKYAQAVDPDIRTMSTPSGGYGGTSIAMPEVYPYLAETDHRRDIGQTELLVEAAMEVYRSSDMNRPRRPVWPLLGWWSTPSLPGFNESIRVMTEIALAKGAQGIMYAGDTWTYREDMAGSVRRLAEFRDIYGSFLKRLRYEDLGKVALVWNDYEMMGEKNAAGRPNFAPDHRLAAAFRLAGIPFEYVHADQVLTGELSRFEAILLNRYNHATESQKRKIDEFAASGGAVFAAAGVSVLAPSNAIAYDPAEYDGAARIHDASHGRMENVQALAPKIRALVLPHLKSERPITADNDFIACYHVPGPGCSVYFIINTDLYLAQTGTVHLAKPFANAYSLIDKRCVETAGKEVTVKIDKGEWQVLVEYPKAVSGLTLTAGINDGRLDYDVMILAGGSPLAAAVPVTVRLFDPAGNEVNDYRQHGVSGTDGKFTGSLMLAAANDPKGEWRIEASLPMAGIKKDVKLRFGR